MLWVWLGNFVRVKKAALFPLIFCTCARLFAQGEAEEYYGPYRFEPGSVQLIFSDTALLRESVGGAVKDTLYPFASVRVVKGHAQLLTVGRKKAPFYEVQYSKGGKKQSAYLWGGTLAIAYAERAGVFFSFGLLSYPQPAAAAAEHATGSTAHTNTCAIKAQPVGGGATQQCLYNISAESGYFGQTGQDEKGKVYNPRFSGAKSLPPAAQFLVHFYMSGEACGIPSYTISAAWAGQRLIRMPLLESNVDGGAWSYEEKYVYPADRGGKAGHLIVRGTSEEYDDRSEKPKVVKRTVASQAFRWNEGLGRFMLVGK